MKTHLSITSTFCGLLFALTVGALAMAGPAPAAQTSQPSAPASAPVVAPALQPATAPVLQLTLRPGADRPAWGEIVTYTLVMRNTGDAAASGAALTNTLPDGLTYLSGTLQTTAGAAEYLLTPRTIRWQGDLAPSGAVTLTYAAQLVTLEYIYNTAVLTHPLAAAVASATSSPADDWGAPEVIAGGRIFDYRLASYRNIAVDSQGRPRIAYAGESGLYYATFNNGVWTSVPVTTTRSTRAALVLDPQDRALIAFYDDYQGYIWLAREISPTANIWSMERVSAKAFGGNFTRKVDIQLDSAGRLHMVYRDDDPPSGHYYTVYSGTTWLTPTLAVASSTCAFALDGNDVPHLACTESVYLRLYTYDGSAWTYENVDSGLSSNNTTIYVPSLAYSGTVPHIAYLRQNNGLYYATRAGAWIRSQVDFSPWQSGVTENTPLASKVAVRGGQIAIAYAWRWYPAGSTTHTETIRAAYRPLTGTTWITESVDGVTANSWSQNWAFPALALTSDGRSHLAYYYLTDSALRHAAQTNSFAFYSVDESLELGYNAALDVDRDGGTHVAYVANGLRYAYSAANSSVWTRTLAVAGVAQDALLDLAVDGANAPHVVYQSALAAPLRHATLTGGAWIVRAVDTPGAASYPALDADAAGTADVAYIALEGANRVVRYGHFTATTWTTATLAIAGPDEVMHWQSPGLVAQGGKVYVLYADCTAYQPTGDYPITLTLRTLSGGVWSAQALHTFTGQCNDRLAYYLLGDSAGRLAAVAVIADQDGNTQELTFWLAADGTPQTMTISRLSAAAAANSMSEVSAAGPQSILGYDFGRYRQVRGDGLETLYVSSGQKKAVYRDRSGAASVPVTLATTLDTSYYLQDLACYGQNAAALERSDARNALAVERARPRPRPSTWANATISAIPAAVYAYDRITYTIHLEWLGGKTAAIQVRDDLSLDPVEFVPDSLSWGPYITSCQYDPYSARITCSGNFPVSEITPLSTQVTYAVTPTCQVYNDGSQYVNTAVVDIGDYHFTPSARTALKAPFKLRASTPQLIPAQYFAPVHEALLYTVPKGDEPEPLKNCQLAVYTRLRVGTTTHTPQPMRNDAQNPDFNARDWHYSQWAELIEPDPHVYELYVAGPGQPFAGALPADTLTIGVASPRWFESPRLVVLTDFQAMFNEWGTIGQHYPMAERDAHVRDQNNNCILDFYDAVERIRQYAADEDGVVIDVARDAYDTDTRNTGFYYSFANRVTMGNQIDAMVAKLPRTVKNVAIIGNDAVVPYARLGVAGGAYPEVRYTLFPVPYSVTGADREKSDLSDLGAWLSDIPYGTWTTARPATPRLQSGVGRVFRDKPLDLVALIDHLDISLNVGRDGRVWVLNTRQLQETRDPFHATYASYSDEVQEGILPTLRRYLPRTTRLTSEPAPSGQYPAGVYWLDGEVRLRPNNWRWANDTVWTAVHNGNVLIFVGPGGERGMQTGDVIPLVERFALASSSTSFGQFGLVLAAGNHAGLLPAGGNSPEGFRAEEWRSAWFGNAAAEANVALLAPTARIARVYNPVLGFLTDIGYPLMYSQFLDNLFYDWHQTLGQAQIYAQNYYAGTADRLRQGAAGVNAQVLYTTLLNGLPTQRLYRGAGQRASVAHLATWPSAASLSGVSALQSTHTIARSVVLSHFEAITDTEGRVAFAIPHNGLLSGEPYGPALPIVQHSYILPAAATDISLTLTLSQGHSLGPITPIPLTPVDEYGQPLTGVITLTNPYPASILACNVFTDTARVRVDVYLAAQQYNPATRQATLYDRLDYQITYTAPDTYTIAGIQVNNGAPVNVNQTALPITVTFNATQPFSGTLYWAIHDVAGLLLDVNHTPLSVTAGVYQIGLTSNTLDWSPGPKQIVVFAATERNSEDIAIAAGHTLFTVQGRGLELAMDKRNYGAGYTTATLTATVRDETGAAVAGQAGNLAARLDGAPLALTWQGSGVYTAALDLTSVVTGQHFISVTLGSRVVEEAFIVDLQPPTSTVSGPAIVYSPTFTVALAGGDDLSGIGAYRVQYRIGNGAWTDWLTRTTGWDYASGGPAYLSPTFGPTQPVALQPGQTVSFRTRAVDRAGNEEAEHPTADLTVTYNAPERRLYLPVVLRQSQ